MTAVHPITVVGGGLAGLTLGVALRQRDVPVTLYEAGSYPRHRVCGEFICGRGIDVLHTLGLYPKFVAAGAVEARSAAFGEEDRSYRPKALPRAALCLSRHTMDRLLTAANGSGEPGSTRPADRPAGTVLGFTPPDPNPPAAGVR